MTQTRLPMPLFAMLILLARCRAHLPSASCRAEVEHAEPLPVILPDLPHPEAGMLCQRGEFLAGVLAGILGMDGFIPLEPDFLFSYAHALRVAAAQMHLHPPQCLVVERMMLKTADIEIRIQFAVDALQEIEIEGGRNTCAVV